MRDWQDFQSFRTICYEEKMKQSRINVDRSEHLYPVLLRHEFYETNICGEYWWYFVWLSDYGVLQTLFGLQTELWVWFEITSSGRRKLKKLNYTKNIRLFLYKSNTSLKIWKKVQFFREKLFCVRSRWCNNCPSHCPWFKYSLKSQTLHLTGT